MKKNVSVAGKCIFIVFFVNLLCLILYFSLTAIAVGTTTENIGYIAYATNEDGSKEELYEYHYADGEDLKLKKYEEEGRPILTIPVRSEMSYGADLTLKIVTAVLSLLLLVAFLYNELWLRGNKDVNLVAFGHIEDDKNKGLKIGLITVVPFALSYLVLVVDKIFNFFPEYLLVYKLINYNLAVPIEFVANGAKSASEISPLGTAALLLTLLPIPIVSTIGYRCGVKGFSIKEKLMYKAKGE